MKVTLIFFILMTTVLEAGAQYPGIPSYISDYIENSTVTEDGLPGGAESDARAFIAYFEANWKLIVELVDSGVDERKQSLIISAAEFLKPETYLAFSSEAISLFEKGKLRQIPLENLISGETRKRGFLYANSKDDRVNKLLLRARESLPDDSRIATEIEGALAGNVTEELARQLSMNGLPSFEVLPPAEANGKAQTGGDGEEKNGGGLSAQKVSDSLESSPSDRISINETKNDYSESPAKICSLLLGAITLFGILLLLLRVFLRGRAS